MHFFALSQFFFIYIIISLLHQICGIGYRLVGDVDYAGCKEVASKITPVSNRYVSHTDVDLPWFYSVL